MPEHKLRTVRRQYAPEFKQQIAELCLAGHKSKRDIAEEYGLSESMVYEWIKRYKEFGTFDKASIRAAKETDVERLQKQIKRLEMENAILKDLALVLNKNQTKK